MIINAAFDLFQALVMSPIFEKLDIYTLKEMNHFLLFVLMMVIAVLLFLYQKWQDTYLSSDRERACVLSLTFI